jgi:hypothetical protein
MKLKKGPAININYLIVLLFFFIGCSSNNDQEASTQMQVNDSLPQETQIDISDSNKKLETEADSPTEPLALEMNEFEKALQDAVEEGMYLVQTEEGFDYVKVDIDKDGYDDAIALFTDEDIPENYDFETITFIMAFHNMEDIQINQSEANSQNLGGESIKYKDTKKLKWENEKLTYFHQSMRSHIEVDIKIEDFYGKAYLTKVTNCSYDGAGCEDLYVASEQQDTLALSALSLEFLGSIR